MLRPYQEIGLHQIQQYYLVGTKRVLLHLATGAGKTVIFCTILKGVFQKGNRGIMLVRGRKLVEQASNRLFREGVPHGVMMANHWNYRPHERIQICSIDTLKSRGLYPKTDIVILDEADLFTSDGDQEYLSNYTEPLFLPVTATPYGRKGLGHMADVVVHPITMKELIEQGYLVGPRYFCPNVPDLSGVRIEHGDYKKADLIKIMEQKALVGDIVKHWKEIANNEPTLGYAVSIDHSKFLVQEFKNAGIKAAHFDNNHTDRERQSGLYSLEHNDLSVIFNVGIHNRGVDLPYLANIIMARPTKSYNLYVQQAGRGTRPCPERRKKYFRILDHAANVLNHGFITEEKEANLSPPGKERKTSTIDVKICENCYSAYQGDFCDLCGHGKSVHSKAREFMNLNGKLVEITDETFGTKIEREIKYWKEIAKDKGYKKGWVFHQVVDAYGEKIAEKYIPKRIDYREKSYLSRNRVKL